MPTVADQAKLTALDVPALELARQITLIEADILNTIQHSEFYDGNWYGKRKDKKSPNVLKLIDFGQHLSDFVTTEVLRRTTAATRAQAISHFVQVVVVRRPQIRDYLLHLMLY